MFFGITVWLLATGSSSAQIVVDTFPGFDGVGAAGCWTPVVVELSNKGAPVSGVIEIEADLPMAGQRVSVALNIPTQTNKRLWVYLPPTVYGGDWRLHLLNERGKVIYETKFSLAFYQWPGRLAAESLPPGSSRMGLRQQSSFKLRPPWTSARILKQHLPDSAVGYDGVAALHLGWTEINDLSVLQKQAMLDWIGSGGHLIVSAHDPNAWRADPWWASLLPVAVASQEPSPDLMPLQHWLDERRLREENELEKHKETAGKTGAAALKNKPQTNVPEPTAAGPMQPMETLVGRGTLMRGWNLIERDGLPLIAQRRLGRGYVTQLLFNPSNEPFRGWGGSGAFWLRLLQTPHDSVDSDWSKHLKGGFDQLGHAQQNFVENFITNLLSTDQQRKMPWVILSGLLVGYVVLIGPVDYVWLKRRRKLVWTWLTFPAYVVGVTLLLYGIGYWVNAGESEWKQWTVVDWLQNGARQRVTTMARYFSTRHGYYRWHDAPGVVVSQVRAAEDRGMGTVDSAAIVSTPSGVRVKAAVPVWTSRSFVGRLEQDGRPLGLVYDRTGRTLTLGNPTSQDWKNCRWITGPDDYRVLGELKAGERKTWRLADQAGQKLDRSQNHAAFTTDYGRGPQGRIAAAQWTDAWQNLFFFVRNSEQFGRIGEGLDLAEGWHAGDAVFTAESEGARDWPWQLEFRPSRHSHHVTHRIYFPAQPDTIPPVNPVEMPAAAPVDSGETPTTNEGTTP